MFATGINTQQVVARIQAKLMTLRNSLEDARDLQKWAAAVTQEDIEMAAGLSAEDAATLLSAIADASALADFYDTGLPPSTYPQPASAYVYGQSQRAVIGPQ